MPRPDATGAFVRARRVRARSAGSAGRAVPCLSDNAAAAAERTPDLRRVVKCAFSPDPHVRSCR